MTETLAQVDSSTLVAADCKNALAYREMRAVVWCVGEIFVIYGCILLLIINLAPCC